MRSPIDPSAVRQRLTDARLLLVFTPALVPEGEALGRLVAAAPWLGLVQVRPKALGGAGAAGDVTEARAARDWSRAVLDALERAGFPELPVVVNDRVDVAALLAERGLAGVHLGADDAPAEAARALLGDDALIGLSTHTLDEVLAASERPVDLVGFGPVFATSTKGYGTTAVRAGAPRVLGSSVAWIASEAASVPLFPIGGIDVENVDELAEVGRAAVSSAILAADDPARAARSLYEALGG
ncbi:MAG: thiamine phosphate synthase [Planctomycetota bacterium]